MYSGTGAVPVALVFRVVHVGVRTPVQTAVVQVSFVHINPSWLHVTVGYVYTLEAVKQVFNDSLFNYLVTLFLLNRHLKSHTHLDDAVDHRLCGLFDVAVTGDHKQRVLEVPARSAVSVSPTQNHIFLPVQVAILFLQSLKNLNTKNANVSMTTITPVYRSICFQSIPRGILFIMLLA